MEEIILRAKAGDQSAIEQIVSDYKGLVRSVANKYYLVGGDKDDLLQEGDLGVYLAINGYDENKGSFPSFVRTCVVRQIIDVVKMDSAVKNKPLKDYCELSVVEEIPDEHTPLEDLLAKEYANKVAAVIAQKLSPLERRVVRLYSQGYCYDNMAQILNKSTKAVDCALQRARKKLLSHTFE